MSDEDEYQKLLPINSPHNRKYPITEQSSSSHIYSNPTSNSSEISTFNLNKIQFCSASSNTETTKSELIQRILDSLNSSSNTSLSSINERQNLFSNKIYIHFKDENELGLNPHIDDLLDQIELSKNYSCHRVDIIFDNNILNEQLSYKQKQSILRIILRRQQIYNQYFSQN